MDWHQYSLSTEMSHNIFIPFYYTLIAVIDNAKSHLVKLTECILNNNLSILLIIELHIYYFSTLLRRWPFHWSNTWMCLCSRLFSDYCSYCYSSSCVWSLHNWNHNRNKYRYMWLVWKNNHSNGLTSVLSFHRNVT